MRDWNDVKREEGKDRRVSTKSEPLAHCGNRSAALVEHPAILGGKDRFDRRGEPQYDGFHQARRPQRGGFDMGDVVFRVDLCSEISLR